MRHSKMYAFGLAFAVFGAATASAQSSGVGNTGNAGAKRDTTMSSGATNSVGSVVNPKPGSATPTRDPVTTPLAPRVGSDTGTRNTNLVGAPSTTNSTNSSTTVTTPAPSRSTMGDMNMNSSSPSSSSMTTQPAPSTASGSGMQVRKDGTVRSSSSSSGMRVTKDTVAQTSGGDITPAPAPVVAAPAPAPAPVYTDTTSSVVTTTTTEVIPARAWLLCDGCFLGVQAGGVLPVREFRTGYRDGWGVNGVLGWQPNMGVFGIQADVGFAQVLGRNNLSNGTATYSNENTHIFSLGTSARLETPRAYGQGAGVYAIGGLSWNHITGYNGVSFQGGQPYGTTGSVNRWGGNIGGGVEWGIGVADLFLEARWVRLWNNMNDVSPGTTTTAAYAGNFATSYVPITFGFRVR